MDDVTKLKEYDDYNSVYDYMWLLLDDWRNYGVTVDEAEWSMLKVALSEVTTALQTKLRE